MERYDNIKLFVPAINETVAKLCQGIDKLLPILDAVGNE
jgi:hypothetical protein